jgi:Helix-turn-helix domain
MFSPRWQQARSLLLERFGRTPTVGEVFEFLRESSQAERSKDGDSLEHHEPEAPADDPPRSQPGRMNQRLCWSLKEAAERCGVSYHTLYRAACRGDLKIIKGFGRMMVSESELPRFVANVTEYLPRKRKR